MLRRIAWFNWLRSLITGMLLSLVIYGGLEDITQAILYSADKYPQPISPVELIVPTIVLVILVHSLKTPYRTNKE